MNLDFRTMDPKPFMEIFPCLMPQGAIPHQVVLRGKTTDILPPSQTSVYAAERPSYETACPIDMATLGETIREPLGSIVHARSGDKADNSNCGFFVRYGDEYPWLQSLLTVDKFKSLLGDDYRGQRVERVEFPLLNAVHL
jgi:hypothetical protein